MKILYLVIVLIVAMTAASRSHAAEAVPIELAGVGVTEHLGESVSLDLPFKDETGSPVTLRRYFEGERPVLLLLVYYECPNLCHFLLNGFSDSLKEFGWKAGENFKVVAISIDPGETPETALKKRETLGAGEGWHFLTGQEPNIRTLAEELGFHYRYDAIQKQYAHSAVIHALTPQGKISRYLYGINFQPRDLKLALLEAGEGRIGTAMDQLLLFCYHYDPVGKKYALFATRLMQGAGALTVIGLSVLVVFRKRKKSCSHC